MNHRPVCCACQTEMRCEKNEVVVLDSENPSYDTTGYYADLYHCEGCGIRIVSGFSTVAFTNSEMNLDTVELLKQILAGMKPEHIILNLPAKTNGE